MFVGLVILAVGLHKSVVFCLGAALVGMIVGSTLTNVLARREVPFGRASTVPYGGPCFERQVQLAWRT